MQQYSDAPLAVFVVWEPVLPTDWITPGTAVLARLPDTRAAQFWDPDRFLSDAILASLPPGSPERGGIVWDVVMLFPPGVRWDGPFPKPLYSGAPVIHALDGFRQALAQLAARP